MAARPTVPSYPPPAPSPTSTIAEGSPAFWGGEEKRILRRATEAAVGAAAGAAAHGKRRWRGMRVYRRCGPTPRHSVPESGPQPTGRVRVHPVPAPLIPSSLSVTVVLLTSFELYLRPLAFTVGAPVRPFVLPLPSTVMSNLNVDGAVM